MPLSTLRGALLALSLAFAFPAAAQTTFTVNSAADDENARDVDPGDGQCVDMFTQSNPGEDPRCTLRAAIDEANATSGDVVINLPGTLAAGSSGSYTLTRTAPNMMSNTFEDANAFGDLDIDGSFSTLTIRGTGTPGPTVTVSPNDRAFHILSGEVTIERVTITGGTATAGDSGTPQNPDGADGANGGCVLIADQAEATLDQVSINNCSTQSGGNGAAPAAQNTAGGNAGSGGNGGAIANFGTLTLTRSFVYSNGTGDAGSAGNGTAGGGGAVAGGNGGNAGLGGGLYNEGDATIEETTFTQNTAGDPSDGAAGTNMGADGTEGEGGSGGGIASVNGGTVELRNTIVANNSAGDDVQNGSQPGADLYDGSVDAPMGVSTGTFMEGGNNLIGSNGTVSGTFPAGNPNSDQSIVGTPSSPIDPVIGTFQRNSDYAVQAAELGSGSPAINAGANTDLDGNTIAVDGRGYKRPGTQSGDNTVDIGGFEANSEPVVAELVINELDSVTAPSSENDRAEFVEIKNTGQFTAQLADYALVLFSGDDNQSYASYDLQGSLAPGESYVFGDPGVTNREFNQAGLTGSADDIRDEDGAIALYTGNASDYPTGSTAGQNVSTRIDVLVYDNGTQSSRRRDAGDLASAFGQDESEIASGDTDNTSIQRNDNGSYSAGSPTAGQDTGAGDNGGDNQGSPLVSLSIDSANFDEGDTVELTVMLDRTTTGDVTVDLAYSDESVLDGPDSVTIPAGQRSVTVDLDAVNDDNREDAEDATVSIDAVSNGVEDGNQSVSVTVGDDVAEISFAAAQQAINESDGSLDLEFTLSDVPSGVTEVTVTLTSGDPADLEGFESRTFDVSEIETADGRFVLTIPVTDDEIAEEDETFVFEISVSESGEDGERTIQLGGRTQTAVIIVDNDEGQAASATLPIRDRDGDGIEDGGFRFLAFPIGGVAASDLAEATGSDVFAFNDTTGAFTVLEDGDVIGAGQPVVVELAPGADITLDGIAFDGDVTFRTNVVATDVDMEGQRRVLVSVGNPSNDALPISALEVDGGTLADVALVLDDETGGFRPVRLSDLEDAVLPAFGAAIFQVIPDSEDGDVTVSAGFRDGDVDASGDDLTDASTETDDVWTVSIIGTGTGAGNELGDTFALRLDGLEGLDPLDAVDVESPGGVTFSALEGGLPFAALALGDDLDFGPSASRTIPLSVMVPGNGTYDVAISSQTVEVNGRTLKVELLDNGVALSPGQDLVDTISIFGDTDGRFALRLTVQNAVSSQGDLEAALSIGQPYPNPTVGASTLEVAVAETETVRVAVYDVLGRQVAVAHNGTVTVGTALEVDLGAGQLAPGSYVIRVQGESFAETRRLTVGR